MLEYDKVAPGTKTKDWYYTEAAQNLNKADEAYRTAGPGAIEEEPVSLAMGKSESCRMVPNLQQLTRQSSYTWPEDSRRSRIHKWNDFCRDNRITSSHFQRR